MNEKRVEIKNKEEEEGRKEGIFKRWIRTVDKTIWNEITYRERAP